MNVLRTAKDKIAELREKHGFKAMIASGGKHSRFGAQSKQKIQAMRVAGVISCIDRNGDQREMPWPSSDDIARLQSERQLVFVPGNIGVLIVLEQKFKGFRWYPVQVQWGDLVRSHVDYTNFPTIGGVALTLAELLEYPIEHFDQYRAHEASISVTSEEAGKVVESIKIMNGTGIGYKGLEGVSWLPGVVPFDLGAGFLAALKSLGNALFCFFDTVVDMYGQDTALTELLNRKRPDRISPMMLRGTMGMIRPDVVAVKDSRTGLLRPVVTELESCPAGQGMAHAMQVGYGLAPDMLDGMVALLGGRPFVVMATHQWSEYVWDQATFCHQLRQRGVDARVVFDAELGQIDQEARKNWNPPKGLPAYLAGAWRRDFLRRLHESPYADIVHGVAELPKTVGDAVVFRFGYFDNFSASALDTMARWQEQGADIVNPLQFGLESKALMAAIWLPSVAGEITRRYGEETLAVLQRAVAETRLLDSTFSDVREFVEDQQLWLTKFAGWDGNNQSWGARSLSVGAQISPREWETSLRERAELPHPVVAQHLIASAAWDIPYLDHDGVVRSIKDARIRVTPFFLRDKQGAVRHCGSTATFRSGSFRIHGASDAVEMPIIYNP